VDDLQRRAFAAYFRTGGFDQPSGPSGEPYTASNGKTYVPLYNGGGLLAVYRVDTVGRLKRLKRWPKQLDQKFAA
jgi:hypothetical protein